MKKTPPSMDKWIEEAKKHKDSGKIGMYLFHNGTVRQSPKSVVRQGAKDERLVRAMDFSYDKDKLEEIIQEGYKLKGIYYIRVWLNEGLLDLGDDIMYVLIGGDIRPNVIDGLQDLVEKIKNQAVVEREIY